MFVETWIFLQKPDQLHKLFSKSKGTHKLIVDDWRILPQKTGINWEVDNELVDLPGLYSLVLRSPSNQENDPYGEEDQHVAEAY